MQSPEQWIPTADTPLGTGEAPKARAIPLLDVPVPESLLDFPLADLDLTPKTRLILSELGATTVGDLECLTYDEYMAVKGAGLRSVERLRGAVADARLAPAPADEPDAEESVLTGEHPDWVLDTALDTLEFTRRLRDAFAFHDARTVRDLLDIDAASLMGCDYVGRGSLARLRATVAAYEEGRLSDAGVPVDDPDAPVLPAILSSIDRLGEREADIMRGRAGIGGSAESLQEIGDRLGVTRERIRQIEAKTIRYLSRISSWVGAVRERLRRMAPGAPFTVEGLLDEPWCAGMGFETLAYVIRTLGEPHLYVTEANRYPRPGMEGTLVVPIPASFWGKAVGLARRAIYDSVAEPTIEDVARSVSLALSEELDENARNAAMRYVGLGGDGGLTLAEIHSLNVSRRSAIRAILALAGGPLTITEIHRRLQEADGDDTGAASLRNTLATEAYWLGGDMYGSLLDVEAAGDPDVIVRRAVAVMRTAPHRRWRVQEIVPRMSGRAGVGRDPAIVAHVLREHSRLNFHGHWTFSLSESAGGMAEVTVQDAVESILDAAGGPMPWLDIRDILRSERGLHDTTMVTEVGRVFRLGRGLWGLIDRDMPISPERRVAIVRLVGRHPMTDRTTVQDLHDMLREAGADMTDLNVALLAYVLRTSGAYEIGRNGTIRPPGTGKARPGSCREAVMEVMREATGPLTGDEVAIAVSHRIGYLPAHSTVRNGLLEVADFDDSVRPRVWRYRAEP